MVRSLLIRGMLVGVVAGLFAFAVARVFGEPNVDQAIAFEEMTAAAEAAPAADVAMAPHDHADAAVHDHGGGEEELVSRGTQAGLGLFVGVVAYGAAFGGLFALVFGFANGRVGKLGPRGVAAIIAVIGFVAIVAVPALKYPANPPAVGHGETIAYRTALFLTMIVISLLAVCAAAVARRWLLAAYGAWNASIGAGLVFVAIVVVAMLALPTINEVPENFPASLLWQFRISSLGTQAIMWTILGLGFGLLTERRWPRPA